MGLSKLRLPALAVLAATLAGTGECGSPVKLIYAKALQRAVYLDAFGWMEGHIEVENRGFEKDVVVRYREMQTEEWHDVAATYAGPIRGTFERWTFRTPEVQFSARLAATFRFAIRYRVNGQEYWDNNSGSDYVVGVGPRPLGPEVNLGTADVVLKKADLWPAQENGVSRLSGEIILRNLGFQKSVKVEATPDDGDTILNVDATYGHPYGDDTEIWYVQGDIPSPAGHRLQCWVRYTVNAQTYLDTNFGANYELRTVPMLMELTIASGDSTVPVEIPGGVTGPTVRFKGRGADNVPGHDVRLEVEVRPVGVPFTGAPNAESVLVPSGEEATATVDGLASGAHRIRVRVMDSAGVSSNWVAWGPNGEEDADFSVVLP